LLQEFIYLIVHLVLKIGIQFQNKALCLEDLLGDLDLDLFGDLDLIGDLDFIGDLEYRDFIGDLDLCLEDLL
jgi:hypothetical protein